MAMRLSILYAKSRPVAGVSSGHADMNLVPLSQCKRSRRYRGFKSGFLTGVLVRAPSVVKHTPAASFGHDSIFRDTRC
jgi:hypothetical protein